MDTVHTYVQSIAAGRCMEHEKLWQDSRHVLQTERYFQIYYLTPNSLGVMRWRASHPWNVAYLA
jgi:hypothetical protein